MSKKNLLKIFSLMLVMFILVAAFAGCTQKGSSNEDSKTQTTTGSSDSQSEETSDSTSEALVSDKKITLKIMAQRDAMGGPWENLRIFKDLEEMTNIHFEFDVVYEGYDEKKNLALATGDLPDIFLGGLSVDDEETYGPQGLLIDLTDLIEKYGTNIKATFEKYPTLKRSVTSSDGKIYALGQILKTPTMGSYKPVINATWLKNLNLSVPETTEELYNVLKAFKTQDPNQNGQADEIPLGEYQFDNLNGMLLPAFGSMAQDIWVKDGKVTFTPMTDAYKHYLEYLNRLYKEELIDPMFISQSIDEFLAKTKLNVYGVLGAVRQSDWTQFQMLSPLTSQYNSEKFSSSTDRLYSTGRFAITKANKYPVESIKWADLFFTELDDGIDGITGAALWIGRRGVDWDFTEDKSAVKYLFTPEEGQTEIQYLLQKVTPSQTGFVGQLILEVPFESPYLRWVGENNTKYVFPYLRNDWIYPSGARFTKEEHEKLSILKTDIGNYVQQERAKFVTGDNSFDKWGEYIQTLKNMKIDEYIQIYQDAYDRFMKNN
ncbi:MAG TPA: extracellular solute-binding protein [Clostridiaceae bacterium]|nr:extracellular solute-binding protein [Clostridiaceae bacterium]